MILSHDDSTISIVIIIIIIIIMVVVELYSSTVAPPIHIGGGGRSAPASPLTLTTVQGKATCSGQDFVHIAFSRSFEVLNADFS